MGYSRKAALAAVVTTLAFVTAPAWAATDVKVSLWDKPDMDMMTGLGHGMGGDMSKASMGLTLSQASGPAGKVTFEVTNNSKDQVHEMIVAPLKSAEEKLPYLEDQGRVDEESAGHLGEVSEMEPGATGALTLTLKPGEYILYCNMPGHYMAGMWTVFTVK